VCARGRMTDSGLVRTAKLASAGGRSATVYAIAGTVLTKLTVEVCFSQCPISFSHNNCTVLFYSIVSCFVTDMAVLVTTLVLLLLINLDLDLKR